MGGHLTVVVGAQFGSEGKGAIAAALTYPDTVTVRVAGPNAGHTAVAKDGTSWALRQIPAAAVVGHGPVVIAAGSEIDVGVLESEVRMLDAAGHGISQRLVVDAQATIIEPRHKQTETGLVQAVGSTGKGIGAARADRLMRQASLWGSTGHPLATHPSTSEVLINHLANGGHVLVEGTQGYGLGLHAGHYPKCTSSDTRAIDMLAMAGINPWGTEVDDFEVAVVARTFPIRVAGASGELKGETTWDDLGLPTERTTVTQKVRRVGTWDPDLVRSAVTANGRGEHTWVALTMFDHLFPELAGKTSAALTGEQRDWLADAESQIGAPIRMLGTGPSTWINR